MVITVLLIIIIAFLIAALPLHLAVKMLGGKSTLFKALLVNMILGLVVAGIHLWIPFANIVATVLIIWIYREIFRLKWFKALLAWIIQATLTFLFILILSILFGVSLLL